MHRDNKEDILLNSKAINLLSSTSVLIIGGGRAGFIKLKSFAKKNFRVDMLSREFNPEILEFMKVTENIRLIIGNYDRSHIAEYELIIIGTDDQELNQKIALDCEAEKKLYLYLPDCNKGKFSVPVEVESENIRLSIGTKQGSPKTAVFLAKRLKSALAEYDEFVGYVARIRAQIGDSGLKKELMEFVNTDEFYELYRAGKAELILRAFYGGDIFEASIGN